MSDILLVLLGIPAGVVFALVVLALCRWRDWP